MGQPIRVTVRGIDNQERQVGPLHNSGEPITLTTQELANAARSVGNPWYSFQFVRIYDTNSANGGVPVADIGPVIVQPNSLLPSQLRVLVAPPPTDQFGSNGQADFNTSPESQMLFPGARSFRSLSAAGCTGVRCAIAVTNDIGLASANPRDQINVAQAYRLQARGQTDGSGFVTHGGNVYADVAANMGADEFGSGTDFGGWDAVGFVLAGQSVQGNISATGAPPSSAGNLLRNGIAKMLVGLGPIQTSGTVFGISGDVRAERGKIGSILCNGPIGTVARRSQILAANGIDEVRVVQIDPNSGTFTQAAPHDINADIVANLEFQPTNGATFDAVVKYVQTDGAFSGSLQAGNIPSAGTIPSGVLVRGAVNAPITIMYDLENASIIGATFTQPIWIGIKSKGVIVATDPVNGTISQLQIGYETNTPDAYLGKPHGMAGIDCEPILPTLASPINQFDADDWLRPTGGCSDGGTSESIVRARTIGAIRIHSMSTRYDGEARKNFVPRIEGETISSIEIGDLREGIVWSGRMEFLADGTRNNDVTNDYASIGTLTIGTVGPSADVWFQGCPRASFTGDVFGELHLPFLTSSQKVIVSGGLLNYTNCGCFSFNVNTCPYPAVMGSTTETEPRVTACATRGAIRIRGTLGLMGQIVLNAADNDPTGLWLGDVIVGEDGLSSPITISPDRPVASGDQAPYYRRTPASLGGGAIGLAPFHLYETACSPEQNLGVSVANRRFATITNSQFVGTGAPILLSARSYGPVEARSASGAQIPWQASNGTSNAVAIFAVDENNHSQMIDATKLFGIHGPGESGWNGDARTIGLSPRAQYVPKPGVYCMVPLNVRCTDVVGLPPVEWIDPYFFRVAPDCNFDGANDYLQVFNNPGTYDPDGDGMICTSTAGKNICRADFNRNGLIEVQDIFDFLSAWFYPCTQAQPLPSPCRQSADVNDSGSVDIQDVFDFLSYWFAANDAVCHLN